jgi:hypothetical protein
MPMWVWIMIGVGSFLGLSLLVAFALARVLGTIGRQVGELFEAEDWTMLPPTRARKTLRRSVRRRPRKSTGVDRSMQRR